MTAQQLKRLGSDDVLRKRLAKYMAQECFRNSHLENLHAGTVPGSVSSDCADVKVVTPYGEIPWSELSRVSDVEMKVLMIDVVNKTYAFLTALFANGAADVEVILDDLHRIDLVPQWNDPD